MEKARACFWVAGGIFAIFVGDILLAKVQVLSGAAIPTHLGDTLQFLVFLVAVTFFVAGALIREKHEKKQGNDSTSRPDDMRSSGHL